MTDAPEQTKFAYWVPNVSGGLVTSTIEQRTDWGYEYNRDLARIAEDAGFEYALSQVRYTASYGAEYQHESTSFSLALLLATERLKVIAAVHPGPLAPGRAGQVGRDRRPPLRRARRGERRVRLVPGRVPPARRAVARARRALPAHRGVHHGAQAHLDRGRGEPRGRLLPDPRLLAEAEAALVGGAPAPGDLPGRQLERRAAQRRHALGLVLLQRQGLRRRPRAARRPARARRERRAHRRPAVRPQRLRHRARHRGRGARHAARDHRQGARRGGRGLRLRRAAGRAVDGRQARACGRTRASRTSSSTTTASARSSSGRPSRSRERIVAYRRLGVDLILAGFLHYHEEVERFGRDVIPIVRELEAQEDLVGQTAAL